MAHNTPTMKEIAKRLGVSVTTVSRALQNHPRIGLRTREQVHELVQEMGYVPNSTAIYLKKRCTFNIGVVLPFLTEQFFSLAISGIEDTTTKQGYSVLVVQSRNNFEREKAAITSLIKHGVDGIIVSVASETQTYLHLDEAQKHGVPVVLFDRVIKRAPNSCVYSDIVVGAYEAIAFLISRGLRRIALLNGPNTLQATEERLRGYVKALQEYEIPVNIHYIKSLNLTKEDTIRKTNELLNLSELPQAILAFHDYIALDSMQVCKERGFRINKDIFFVSFSNLSFCSYLDNPPIASIEQFPYEMGEKAAQILMNDITNPGSSIRQEVVIKSKLIQR
ncbi:LacI family DNA-binding transcriptional regulator [Adhaeribacter radiodurans]|uniref:LacI family DNA-binding transcriptional regulator n=1 Tax=Adhaeribacter radiodurans TaxID=2745197 RepID=A0A7L7L7A8_9BACT|nr:LacI family DNA-binding transcriptional regulator [Adhaeribacter radiodurans]QMU28239.1 LacI family DNA-binding transcriptional regulator [Adhaeribacter radiodurans]